MFDPLIAKRLGHLTVDELAKLRFKSLQPVMGSVGPRKGYLLLIFFCDLFVVIDIDDWWRRAP